MRKLVSAVISICFILGLFIAPVTVSAQELSIKKVISVVFDDSGSMNDASKKWVYANYAMQTFTGLLNQKDELSITYMSEYGIAKGFDVSKNVQKSVDNVRDHFRSGGTPKEAIDTAIAKLKSTNDPNPNTQYWLVVITDGKIYPVANEDAKLTDRDLTDLFTSFTSEKMPNGTNPQVSYFAIGSQAIQIQEDTNNNLNSYFASTSSEIFEVMSRIADKVSGRTRIGADKLIFLDEYTVQFTSELPMLNIAVLAQKTSATVESAAGSDAILKLDQSAKLLYPKEQTELPTDESLKGTTFLFTNGPDNTPPGTYTISFSEPVTADSVVIMYEPAIEIRMRTYLSGTNQEVTNLKDLYAGEEIDVFGKIYESGTDTEIDANLLKDNVAYNIAYQEEGTIKSKTSDKSLTIRGINLKELDCELKASVEIPGFAPMTSLQRFRPMPPVEYAMTVATPDGSSISRNDLFRNDKGMVFTIFGDGLSLSKEKAEKLDVHFTLEDPYGKRLELKQHLNSDGTFSCTPLYTKGLSVPNRGIWNWLVSWPGVGVPTGELKVSAGIGEGVFQTLATGTMQVEQESWLQWSANIFVPILIPIYILGLVMKRKFARGLKVRSIDVVKTGVALISPGPNWSVHKLRKFTIRSLIPYYHSSVKVRGVMFHARPGGYVGVRVKDVGAQSSEMDSAMIQDNNVVNYLTSQLSDPFVPQEAEDLKHTKYKDFTNGDVFFNTKNIQNGRIFKFSGEK